MVLVLTIPHSLPFRQPLLMAVIPPDAFTVSLETSNRLWNLKSIGRTFRLAETHGPFRLSEESRPAAPSISTALHRLNLILRAPPSGTPASLSA
jgi:hypothetical protein